METARKILIVDDEEDICNILSYNLEKSGYRTTVAHSAEEALTSGVNDFDLILLDIMMDSISGLQMAEMIRKNPRTAGIPIIFITAKATEEDTITGFNTGADDYIAKPFSVREVISRVGAVLRRTSTANPAPEKAENVADCLEYNGLKIDTCRKAASIDGMDIDLTKIELQILQLLLGSPSHVFSREDILKKVWPENVIVLDRTIDVNITRLRKKLGSPYGECIVTRHGYGYCFEKK